MKRGGEVGTRKGEVKCVSEQSLVGERSWFAYPLPTSLSHPLPTSLTSLPPPLPTSLRTYCGVICWDPSPRPLRQPDPGRP